MSIRSLLFILTATLTTPFIPAASAQVPPTEHTTAGQSAPVTLPTTLPVKEDDMVWVTTSKGWDIKGDIIAITKEGIDLQTDDGAKHLDAKDIQRIDRRDSNWSGFVKGVGVGAIGWAMVGGTQQVSDAHGNVRTERIGFGQTAIVLMLFGGVGAVLDSFVEGRDNIYARAEESTNTPRATPIAPPVSTPVAAPASAPVTTREPMSSTPQAQLPNVHVGQKVWVTSFEGLEVSGVVSRLSRTFIEVSGVAGTTHIELADAKEIDIKDSNWSGFWTGAAIGGGLTALMVSNAHCSYNCRSDKAFFVAIEGLSGGGVGALIDFFHEGRQSVWTNRGTTTAHLSPVLAPKAVGVSGSITWK